MTASLQPLTEPQLAALAKVACGIETGAAVALLCGPAGVGKTTVLEQLASDPRLAPDDLPIRDVAAWLSTPGDLPAVLLADDAHLASEHDLAQLLARAKSRRPAAAVILAGQGRLLTLVARDRRIEQGLDAVYHSAQGVLGPRGMAPEQIQFWENLLREAVKTEGWQKLVSRNHWRPTFLTGAEARAYLDAQNEEARAVLGAIGLLKK